MLEPIFCKQNAIETSAAIFWKGWRSGPAEAEIFPISPLLQNTLPLVWKWRWYGRKSAIRILSRLFSGKEVFLRTQWGATIVAPWHDAFFLQGVCSEPIETAFVTRLVKPGMTVIDVGANRGWYTILFSKLVGSEGKVFAFEPDPRAFKQLKRNIEVNSFTSNTTLSNQAVSNFVGTADFVIKRDNSVSHLERSDENSPRNSGQMLKTDCIDLAEFVKNRNLKQVDFIKIDVEGAEMKVLEGLCPIIRKGMHPILLLEVIDRNLRKYKSSVGEFVSFLKEIEYVCLPVTPRSDEFEPKTDFIFSQIRNYLAVSKELENSIKKQLFNVERTDKNNRLD